jgi:LAO/AO transport system kinase
MSLRGVPVTDIFERACAGERRAVGRLLSLTEAGGESAEQVAALAHPLGGDAHVVGVTGAPGAGKSTITGRLAAGLEADGPRLAILAIDPSSPLTGGAILGDRIRMDGVVHDPSTFIRSMATRGHGGGLALAVPAAIRVLDAVGFDLIIVETVGVGQVEVDVAGAADTTVVVVTPGWGDAVQANKAGLLEVADVFVVNKADRPGASDARRDLELMLDLSGSADHLPWRPPIVLTSATKGEGVAELQSELTAHREWLEATGEIHLRRSARGRAEVRDRLQQILAEFAEEALNDNHDLLAEVDQRLLSPDRAAQRMAEQVIGTAFMGSRES